MTRRTIVRCSSGALYSTIWIPLISFKAVRLGGRRWQRCPVHKKFETVEPVDTESLSPAALESARNVKDAGVW